MSGPDVESVGNVPMFGMNSEPEAILPLERIGDRLVVGRISFPPREDDIPFNPTGSGRALMQQKLDEQAQFRGSKSPIRHRAGSIDDQIAEKRKGGALNKYLKFLPDALAAKGRSKDRSTQVGAVVIDDDFNVRVSGYNGMARGVDDDVEDRHQRPQKYLWAAHSEENCVAQAARSGISLKGCTILLTSLFPCATCSRLIIQAGIKRIIAPAHNDAGDGKAGREDWDAQFKVSKEMLAEAGVEVLYYEEVA